MLAGTERNAAVPRAMRTAVVVSVRLPARALKAEAAQRRSSSGTRSDALEVLTDSERAASAYAPRRWPSVLPWEGAISPSVSPGPRVWVASPASVSTSASLFDEVDGGSIVVEGDDLGARLNLELAHRGSQVVELC